MDQETLLDYTPDPDEESARLKKLAEAHTAKMQILLDDPIIAELGEVTKRFDKVINEYIKAKESAKKLSAQIETAKKKTIAPVVAEPTEDGFYILTETTLWERKISTNRRLYLKKFGTWFDLDEGGNSEHFGMTYGRPEKFAHFINVDSNSIEVSLIRYDGDTFPRELLNKSDAGYINTDTDTEDGEESGDEVDE